jgi:hypothetical protein
MRVLKRLIRFIVIIQSVLFLTHLFLYETWKFSTTQSDPRGALWIKLVFGCWSVSFVLASLLAFRYTNAAVRAFYKVAADWVGQFSFPGSGFVLDYLWSREVGWTDGELP